VMVAVGICNLTQKIHHTGGTEITYTHSTDKTAHIIKELQDLQEYVATRHNTPLKIACSISKYAAFNTEKHKLQHSTFTPEQISNQQQHLETDIQQINDAIITINNNAQVRTVRWDRDLLQVKCKSRGKHRQNKAKIVTISYKQLYDGVYPCETLYTKWYSYMCNSIISDISQPLSVSPVHVHDAKLSSDQETDDEPDISWDFKRAKMA
jgi:hypothetical protein